MTLLRLIFTWWSGQTFGTAWFTLRRGRKVGTDSHGNTYYQDRKNSKRRWIIYQNLSEASKVPAGWHGWLHGTTDVSPADETADAFEWETPHQENLTGTPDAYRPQGSLLNLNPTTPGQKTYDAWSPKP